MVDANLVGSYLDGQGSDWYSKPAVLCSINSLNKLPTSIIFQLVVIDEVYALGSIVEGETMKDLQPNMTLLQQYAKSAEVIVACADLELKFNESEPISAGQYLTQAITLGRPAVCVRLVSEVPPHLRRCVRFYHNGVESASGGPEWSRWLMHACSGWHATKDLGAGAERMLHCIPTTGDRKMRFATHVAVSAFRGKSTTVNRAKWTSGL